MVMGNLFSSLMKLSQKKQTKKICSSEKLLHSLQCVFVRHLFDFHISLNYSILNLLIFLANKFKTTI